MVPKKLAEHIPGGFGRGAVVAGDFARFEVPASLFVVNDFIVAQIESVRCTPNGC